MASYELTLKNAQDDLGIKQIAGVCTDTPEFLSLINDAMASLVVRGGWFDLEQPINFCLSSCHIVWPHFVGTILGVRFCSGLATMQNQWYSFVSNDSGQWLNDAYGLGAGYGTGQFNPYYRQGGRCVIEDAGTRPCYNEITGTTGKLIRYNVVKANDYGKTITLFGKKYGAQPLQEKDASGAWINGLTITAANPFASTSEMVTEIDSITREATEGMAYLYEYDPSTNVLRDLAVFQPYETNPRYRCSRITNMPERKKDANGVCWSNIQALVKLKFIPVKHERDFLAISNLRAVALAIQAVNGERSNSDELANLKWAEAVKALQLDQDYLQPKKQIPARINLGRTLSNPI